MKIVDLVRHPLVKTTGIVLILYFALFSNKENPNSLGNRLSKDRIKQNLGEVQEKSKFIVTNVKKAQQMAKDKELEQQEESQKISPIIIEDLNPGAGVKVASCGDQVNIIYGLYSKNGKQLEFINPKKLVIGSNELPTLERNIVGMKQYGIRNIITTTTFSASNTSDTRLAGFIKSYGTIRYQVTLLSFQKAPKQTTISCE